MRISAKKTKFQNIICNIKRNSNYYFQGILKGSYFMLLLLFSIIILLLAFLYKNIVSKSVKLNEKADFFFSYENCRRISKNFWPHCFADYSFVCLFVCLFLLDLMTAATINFSVTKLELKP